MPDIPDEDDDGYITDFTVYKSASRRKNLTDDKYCAEIGQEPLSLTPHQVAKRNVQNLLLERPVTQRCYKFTSNGGMQFKKECDCMMNLCMAVKEDGNIHGEAYVRKKWIPAIEPLCRVALRCAQDPKDVESLCCFLEFCQIFSRTKKGNAVVDFALRIGESDFRFCVSALWEILGYSAGKLPIQQFMQEFLHTTDEKMEKGPGNAQASNQAYVRKIVLPRSNSSGLFHLYAKLCIVEKILLDPHQFGKDLIKLSREELKSLLPGQDLLSLGSSRLTSSSNLQKRWASVKKGLIACSESGHLFGIGHPHLASQTAPWQGKGELGVLDHCVGQTAYVSSKGGVVRHSGSVGAVRLRGCSKLLSQVKSATWELAGHAGLKKAPGAAFAVPSLRGTSGCVRVTPRALPAAGIASFSDLLGGMGLSPIETSTTARAQEGLLDAAREAALFLCGEAEHGDDYKFFSSAAVALSTRMRFTRVEFFPAQVPHLPNSPAKLKELEGLGIKMFLATVPLSNDGCFLRIYRKYREEGGDVGHLLFVPEGAMLVQPATMVHGGGFRTGVGGNPRLQLELYLVPKAAAEEPAARALASPRDRHYVRVRQCCPKFYRLLDDSEDGLTDAFKNEPMESLLQNLLH